MLQRILLVVLIIGLMPGLISAQNPTQSTEGTSSFSTFLARESLFEEALGVRSWLAGNGISLELSYTADLFSNLKGGNHTHNSGEYRGDFSIGIEFNPAAVGLWRNGTFFMHLQEEHGHSVSDHVGDSQGICNMGADDFKQVSEFWYQHSFGKYWLKLGKQEMNENFAAVDNGGEFINSSAGLLPTVPIDTFPDQGWGIAFGGDPLDYFSFSIGLFEGRPDGGRSLTNTLDNQYGPFLVVEPVFHHSLFDGLEGHVRFGAWYITAMTPTNSPPAPWTTPMAYT